MKHNLHTLYSAIISSPIGKIGIESKDNMLDRIAFLTEETSLKAAENAFAQKIVDELQYYFRDARYTFSDIFPHKSTPFQKRVWQALRKIPLGKTLSYGQLAKQLHSAPRAIGQACRTNPLPLFIPCHRIVAGTHLGGYGGQVDTSNQMLSIKQWLLNHESSI